MSIAKNLPITVVTPKSNMTFRCRSVDPDSADEINEALLDLLIHFELLKDLPKI